MTLLLGALVNGAVVLGADGIEFVHSPNAMTRINTVSRQKIYPVPDRPMLIGLHGQNQLAPVGRSLDHQRLVIDLIPGIMMDEQHQDVRQTCQAMVDRLTPEVKHTFAMLANAGITLSPMGIMVAGFSRIGTRPQCYEAWWPLNLATSPPRVIEHPQDGRLPAVIHSGTGAEFARTAISHGGRYKVDRLKRATPLETQEYVRNLYARANSLQPEAKPVFGGAYHEITVTPDHSEWTTRQQGQNA